MEDVHAVSFLSSRAHQRVGSFGETESYQEDAAGQQGVVGTGFASVSGGWSKRSQSKCCAQQGFGNRGALSSWPQCSHWQFLHPYLEHPCRSPIAIRCSGSSAASSATLVLSAGSRGSECGRVLGAALAVSSGLAAVAFCSRPAPSSAAGRPPTRDLQPSSTAT